MLYIFCIFIDSATLESSFSNGGDNVIRRVFSLLALECVRPRCTEYMERSARPSCESMGRDRQ